MSRHRLISECLSDIWKMTRKWEHYEDLDNGKTHHSLHSSLVEQLRIASALSSNEDESGYAMNHSYGSKMPAVEEPFMVLLAVGKKSGFLAARVCGVGLHGSPEENLIAIAGSLSNLSNDEVDLVCNEIAVLRERAETTLSWRLKSRLLRGKCPECGRNSVVLVRLDDHGPADASCVGCGTRWEREKLGVLAGAMESL